MGNMFKCALKQSGSSGSGADLIVTCSSSFAGVAITCTNGSTYTETKTCPSSSPYEVTFESIPAGTYTISGTISGQTFSTTKTILDFTADLNSIPEGSTVTPTDDVQTLLNCADIWDKTYTTISEVLTDTASLLAIISDNNAVDYLVRSTTWASSVCADSTAMTYIGSDDYCADILLADATWLNAICNSTYFESVLNVKVPTMTGKTTPSGECFASTRDDIVYLAFDNNTSTYWGTSVENTTNHFVGYDFGYNVKIYKWVATVKGTNSVTPQYRFQYLDTEDVWTQIGEIHAVTTAWNTTETFSEIVGSGVCQKARMFDPTLKTSGNGSGWVELQFYGRAAS